MPIEDACFLSPGNDEGKHQISPRLREAREYLGLSLTEASAHLARSPQMLAAWEQGASVPGQDILSRVAQFYRCSLPWLAGEDEAPISVSPALMEALEHPWLGEQDRTQVLRFLHFLQQAGPAPHLPPEGADPFPVQTCDL